MKRHWYAMTTDTTVIGGTAVPRRDARVVLNALREMGQLNPVIDRGYPLEQVADAHRHVDTGRRRGNVVITVCPRSSPDQSPSLLLPPHHLARSRRNARCNAHHMASIHPRS